MVGGHEGAAISEDGGKTWEQVPDLEGADPMGWAIDPTDPKKMYAGGHPGFYRSEDGGESWRPADEGLPGGVSTVAVAPDGKRVVYGGVLDGAEALVYRSDDGGESWEARNG